MARLWGWVKGLRIERAADLLAEDDGDRRVRVEVAFLL